MSLWKLPWLSASDTQHVRLLIFWATGELWLEKGIISHANTFQVTLSLVWDRASRCFSLRLNSRIYANRLRPANNWRAVNWVQGSGANFSSFELHCTSAFTAVFFLIIRIFLLWYKNKKLNCGISLECSVTLYNGKRFRFLFLHHSHIPLFLHKALL